MTKYQKYLKFLFHRNPYQLTCLPNGLSWDRIEFTKLLQLQPVFLKKLLIATAAYNKVLDSFGFLVCPENTFHEVPFLTNFVANLENITISLFDVKKQKIRS